MSKLYIVLDSELRMADVGYNEGGCGVFSTYKDALASAKQRHVNQGIGFKECPHYDKEILIVDIAGQSIDQREVLRTFSY